METPFKMKGFSGFVTNSPLHMTGCAPGDPDCEKGFRIGKQRGKKIKRWFRTAGKNIGKTIRKGVEKVKDIDIGTIIPTKDKNEGSYKNPRFL